MKRKLFALLVIGQIALLLPSCGRLACAVQTNDYKAAVYRVWTEGEGGGSGVGVAENFVITNSHVVDHKSNRQAIIVGSARGERLNGIVIAHNDSIDTAVIYVQAGGVCFRPIVGAPSQVGERITTYGFGGSGIVNERTGTILEYGRNRIENNGGKVIELSQSSQSGDSGSAGFNSNGEISLLVWGRDVGGGNRAQAVSARCFVEWLPELQKTWPNLQPIVAASQQPEQSSNATITLLDFRSDSCGPCREMDPIVSKLAASGYDVRRVDVDANRALAQQYGVSGIPCFVAVRDGKEVNRIVGATSEQSLMQLCCWGVFASKSTPSAPRSSSHIAQPTTPIAQLPPPQNPQGMVPLGGSAKDAEQDQRLGNIEGWIGTVKRTADEKAPLIGKNIPALATTQAPIGSDATLPVPAQPNAPPPIPAAPAPSIDSGILGGIVKEQLQPIVDSLREHVDQKVDGLQADVNKKIGTLPVGDEIKQAITDANNKLVAEQIKPKIDEAFANAPEAALPVFQGALKAGVAAIASSAAGPLGIPAWLITLLGSSTVTGLTGWLITRSNKKNAAASATATASTAAPDIAGVVKPILDSIESKLNIPAVVKPIVDGAIGQLSAQIQALISHLPIPVQAAQAQPVVVNGPTQTQPQGNQFVQVQGPDLLGEAYRQAVALAKQWNQGPDWIETMKNQIHGGLVGQAKTIS